MNLFGKPKDRGISAAKAQATAEATLKRVQDNAVIEEELLQREQELMERIEKCNDSARNKIIKKDKKGALFEMSRKKTYAGEINKLTSMRLVLQQMNMSLESANDNVVFLKSVSETNSVLKNFSNEGLNADNTERIMEEFKENVEGTDEISNLITESAGRFLEDEDLQAALNELLQYDAVAATASEATTTSARSQSNSIHLSQSMPSVPMNNTYIANHGSGNRESDEEREIRELQAYHLS